MGGARGQATVEVALCLPLVAFVLAGVLEVTLVGLDQVRLWHAAREAARVAAVDSSPARIEAAATGVGLTPLAIDVTPLAAHRVQGEAVVVALRHRPSGYLPLVGRLWHPELSARVTMRIEVP